MSHASDDFATRDDAGFIDAVTSSFEFVEREYGFRQGEATPNLVRNERGPHYVEVVREVGILVQRHAVDLLTGDEAFAKLLAQRARRQSKDLATWAGG